MRSFHWLIFTSIDFHWFPLASIGLHSLLLTFTRLHSPSLTFTRLGEEPSATQRRPSAQYLGRLPGNISKRVQCRSENKLSHLASFGDFETSKFGWIFQCRESSTRSPVPSPYAITPCHHPVASTTTTLYYRNVSHTDSCDCRVFTTRIAADLPEKLVCRIFWPFKRISIAGHCLDHFLTFINCYYD